MTDLDVQLRQLATGLTTSRLEPPSFDDLLVAAPAREPRLRRGPLLAAVIAVVVLLVIASVAMIRAEIGSSSSAPVPPADQPDTAPTYRDATLAEQLEYCDIVVGTMRAGDTATKQVVELQLRDVCEVEARTQPDPAGGLGVSWVVENGHLVASYNDKIRSFTTDAQGNRGESVTPGPPVPNDVAAQKVAAYHERLDREAATRPSALPSYPQAMGEPTPIEDPSQVSVRLELKSRTVKAGETIAGEVIVTNATGKPLTMQACGLPFQVALANPSVQPNITWPDCLGSIVLRAGETRLAAHVSATYDNCGADRPQTCAPTGPVPLPPGNYQATVYQYNGQLPSAAPVPVDVT